MITQHYFPPTEAERIIWLNNYGTYLAKYGQLLGIGTEEITSTQKDIASYVWISQAWYPPTQQFARETTAFRTSMATGSGEKPLHLPVFPVIADEPELFTPGLFNRIFNQVQRVKLHPGYTEGIGQDLRIISTVKAVEFASPEFTVTLEQGVHGYHVRLDYVKHGHSGVIVESQVNGGIWQLLGHFTQKSIYDDSPLSVAGTAESRQYRMRWWEKDEAHGDWSAIQSVFIGN